MHKVTSLSCMPIQFFLFKDAVSPFYLNVEINVSSALIFLKVVHAIVVESWLKYAIRPLEHVFVSQVLLG